MHFIYRSFSLSDDELRVELMWAEEAINFRVLYCLKVTVFERILRIYLVLDLILAYYISADDPS